MTNSINNAIPFVPENTVDPAAGLNLSINTIDALLQLAVESVGANAAPAGVEGQRHIVGTLPTGAWAGQANNIARYLDGGWHFYAARYALNLANGSFYVRKTTGWAISAGGGGVDSVNGQTGDVTLDAADVGAGGALAMAQLALGAMTTGLIAHNNGPFLQALSDTTLRVLAVPDVFFSPLVTTVEAAILDFAQQDVALSTAGLVADGVFIRFVGINAAGVISFQSTAINTDPDRVQLGIVYLKRVAGAVTFLDGAAGARNVKTMPIMANVSYTDRGFHELRSSVGISPNAALTMALSAGYVAGEAINWGAPAADSNRVSVAAANPMSFLLFSAGTGASGVVPAPTTLFAPTQYWNGTALTTLASVSNASVQRILITITGTIIVQYGEAEYASLADAAAAMFIAPFTRIFDDTLAVEIARVAMTRNCTDLRDTSRSRIVVLGSGAAASGGAGGGAVDSVNGQTGAVVLTAADVGAITLSEAVVTSASRALTLADINTVQANTGVSAHTFTIPAQAALAWPDDAELYFVKVAAGAVTIAGDVGVVVNGIAANSIALPINHQLATLKRIGADLWELSGAASAAPVIRAITGNETLGIANINTFGVNSTTGNYTSTIPAQAATAWTADAELHFLPSNTGDITITAAAGVSLNGVVAGSLVLSTQNGAATLKRTGVDSWWLGGVIGEDTAVRTTGAQSVAGIKTFTSRVQMQNVAPGFWLDETDGVAGMYVVLDTGVLQFQRRASNFGAFEVSIFSLNIGAPANSLALAADGTFTVAGPALRPTVDNTTTCGTAAVKWSALYTVAASFYGAALVVTDVGSLGYGTGSGATAVQPTSKATGVPLNKPSGQITTASDAIAANSAVSFTLTNNKIGANDIPKVVIKSGATAGAYVVQVDAVAAGSCRISIRNMTAGSLSETLVLQFNIEKGAIA